MLSHNQRVMKPAMRHSGCSARGEHDQRGFTLVEVLVAVLILATVIASLNAAFKQYVTYRAKLNGYENLYLSVLSLKDSLVQQQLRDQAQGRGTLNGLAYRYQITRQLEAKNYVLGMTEQESGNNGTHELSLYKINLEIAEKSFAFYHTAYFNQSLGVPGRAPGRGAPSRVAPGGEAPSGKGGDPGFIY